MVSKVLSKFGIKFFECGVKNGGYCLRREEGNWLLV